MSTSAPSVPSPDARSAHLEADVRHFQGVLTDLALLAFTDLDEALASLCRTAARAMDVARVSVWRYDRTRAAIRSAPAWHNDIPHWDPPVLSAATHPRYWAALHAHRVLAVHDALTDDALVELRDGYIAPHGIGAMLDSGIRAAQQTLGIVCFEHVGGARTWTLAEQEFAASVADRVGLVLALDEQRRLEADLRQTQKMEAIGLLAGGVAHDFNNVLSVILATAELARDAASHGADVQRDLDTITAAAARAAGLTRKLLLIARREQIARERLDVNDLVRDFAAMARSIVGTDGAVDIVLGDGPLVVEADRSFLDQVLLNLVTNARHAIAPGGRVTLETGLVHNAGAALEFGTSLPAGTFVRLTVRDTGRGIAREVLAHIFVPFFSTKGADGTGLGLAVVYGGVRQHNGHVAVESEPGRGTAMHVLLPAWVD